MKSLVEHWPWVIGWLLLPICYALLCKVADVCVAVSKWWHRRRV